MDCVMFNETLLNCLVVASSKFKVAIIIVVDTIETHRLFFCLFLKINTEKLGTSENIYI